LPVREAARLIDDDEIRIKGSKDLLEKAVLASQSGPSGC
jgi:hypothetical protein